MLANTTTTADLVTNAVMIWIGASIILAIVAFSVRILAVGLALIGALIGVPVGAFMGASMGWLELEEVPFGGAVGASLGLLLGGLVGLLETSKPSRIDPRLSRRAMLITAGGVVIAGLAATLVGSRVIHGCWDDVYCHFPWVPALVMIDAVFLALVLVVVALRSTKQPRTPEAAFAAAQHRARHHRTLDD